MSESIIPFPPPAGSLVGNWLSKVIGGPGMLPSGPNPPFYPEGAGVKTTINDDGTGWVDLNNWKLFGKFADGSRQVLYGWWSDTSATTGKQGRFSIMLFRNPGTGRLMFYGVSQNHTGEWQAWMAEQARL